MISDHASPLSALGGNDSGGQNVYVAQVSQQLAKLGYHVDVFTRKDHPTQTQIHVVGENLRVIHVPAGPAKFIRKEELLPWMDPFIRFTSQFIQLQPLPYDLVHANFWLSGIAAAALKRERSIPFVVTFHALGRIRRIFQQSDDGFPDARFEAEDEIIQSADRIIAECPQDINDLLTYYRANPEKISMVPCGFDPLEFWPVGKWDARQKLGLMPDEFVILQLGRIVPRKGIDNVVRGLSCLIHTHQIPARLLIVGGESEDPDPRKTPEIGRLLGIAREEGVFDQVEFVGRRSREVLKFYYGAADVFVTTPWYEPFGITPLEAMACGTPVIGARVGGIQFSVVDGETGYLIPPHDPKSLGERLAYLYSHAKIREKMGRMGTRRVNKQFTWKKVATSLSKIYDEVVLSHRRATRTLHQNDRLLHIPAGVSAGHFGND